MAAQIHLVRQRTTPVRYGESTSVMAGSNRLASRKPGDHQTTRDAAKGKCAGINRGSIAAEHACLTLQAVVSVRHDVPS
jgi:hypothetical protein